MILGWRRVSRGAAVLQLRGGVISGLQAETAPGFTLEGVFTWEVLAKRWKNKIKILCLLLSGWRLMADVWRHVLAVLWSKGVCTRLCVCVRTFGGPGAR